MSAGQAVGDRARHPQYEVLRTVTSIASVVLADNPGIMTLDGTNTWVLRAPGSEHAVLVDPGPLEQKHLAVLENLGPISAILLTHRHLDHSENAKHLAAKLGIPVYAADPWETLGSEGLVNGQTITLAGLEIRTLATPGHTSDSVSFTIAGHTPIVLTGDTILGSGTTVVAHPDGMLADYLISLEKLAELPQGTTVLPGHGPELPEATSAAQAYLAHRKSRLAQVESAMKSAKTPREIVELVYADVDKSLWPAAELSVRAQLKFLSAL
jgi:glyoxylase-like metal-dependent hydrolase (beta-lactamase superfamily II)